MAERWTRRTVIERISAFSAFPLAAGLQAEFLSSGHAQIREPYAAAPQTIMKWMDEAGRTGKSPGGSTNVGRFGDPIYFLIKPIRWEPSPKQQGYEAVEVPTGFVTNFASIPRAFWSLLRPDESYTYAAIVHDYLYWTQTRLRQAADMILKFGMEDFGVDKITVELIYHAVDRFGQGAWDDNAKLKAGGERRILRRFPTDAMTRWSGWKNNQDNFNEPEIVKSEDYKPPK